MKSSPKISKLFYLFSGSINLAEAVIRSVAIFLKIIKKLLSFWA